MQDPVLVRGPRTLAWFIAGIVLGLGLFGLAGGLVLDRQPAPALIAGGIGLVLTLGCGIALAWGYCRQTWLVQTDEGFCLRDRLRERNYRDEQVIATSMLLERIYRDGRFQAYSRRFLIWIVDEQSSDPLVLQWRFGAAADDPLQEFVRRLNGRLYNEARAELRAGRTTVGEGWSLSQSELTVTSRPGGEALVCRLADLVACEPVEKTLRFWRRGEEMACAGVALGSANVDLLERLLNEEIARRPLETGVQREGLGRILFERKRQALPVFLLVLFLLLLLAGAVVMVFMDAVVTWVGYPLAVLLAIGALFIDRQNRVSVFRAHEQGVYHKTLFSEKSLRFDELETFTYLEARKYYKGTYRGTDLTLTFRPAADRTTNTIVFAHHVMNADEELERLRDQVAHFLADRMADRFGKGESVCWTPELTFTLNGIDYHPAGRFKLFGPQARIVPYDAIDRPQIKDLAFELPIRDKGNVTIHQKTWNENFFPGYYLLLQLLDGSERNSQSLPR